MNKIRVPFIVNGLDRPIHEAKLLDVGCGGGLLSEPLGRLGADVLGIDPVFESINQAQLHAQSDSSLGDRLKYRNCNIEDLSALPEHREQYDGLIASEVLEHIEDIEHFLSHCTKVIKPNGSLFITTINQTPLSWLGVIFFGEYVLKQLPRGTHQYNMFVSVKGLKVMLERMGYHIKLVNGFVYEPIGNNFYWTPTTLTHYAIQAVKVSPLAQGINSEQRRYAPKTKKLVRPKNPLDQEEMSKVVPMDLFNSRVEAIITEFKQHLDKNLIVRTSTASVECLKVELEGYSQPFELRDIAQISMKGPSTIVINMSSMPEAIKPTIRALAELGNTNPQVEVNNIFIQLPRVTREHREKLVSLAQQAATSAKGKLGSLFSDFSGRAKQSKAGISVDLSRSVVDNLQYDINKRNLEIDVILQTKTNQLLNQSS